MFTDDELRLLKQHIARTALSEQRIKDLLDILNGTDWKAVLYDYDAPLSQCDACDKMYVPRRYDLWTGRFSLCPDCKHKRGWDTRKVIDVQVRNFQAALDRAKQKNLPATITFSDWLKTLQYFNWKCAYCQQNPYQVLDHFIPICLGGGSTRSNCVPICRQCDKHKRFWHPKEITGISRETINCIQEYLNQF